MLTGWRGPVGEVWDALTELVLPAGCAGCRAERVPLRHGVCAGCASALESLRPGPVRPTPAPAGLPPCAALGAYDGVLRAALLAYKEQGRHGLGVPLGRLLAEVVAAVATGPSAVPTGLPPAVLLVPVPTTAAAVRARQGDHLRRLVDRAAARLRVAGWSVRVAAPLRALPRPDSAGLDAAGRAAAASASIQLRPARLAALRRGAAGRTVVVVDDIVTTGSTLAAVSRLLTDAGAAPRAAALLAATIKRASW